jgi:signal peptidase I
LSSGPGSRPVPEPWWIDWSKAAFPVLVIVLILRSFLAEPFRIPSGSMRPTLLEGDFILVNKFTYGLKMPFVENKILSLGIPKRGDVIVFRHSDEKDMIKRVIGLPGDYIEYRDKIVYVNGEPLKQTFTLDEVAFSVRRQTEVIGDVTHDIFLNPAMVTQLFKYNHVTVPAESYFVLGDNRDNSQDSRYWGFVQDKDVMGRAMAIWMSWDSSKDGYIKVRWERVATKIQ